jgi:hypothetical protein
MPEACGHHTDERTARALRDMADDYEAKAQASGK